MSNVVTIRQAVASDVISIILLWQELMDFHRQRDVHYTRAIDGEVRFREFIIGHLTAPNSYLLVAEHGGRIVGYCLAIVAQLPPVFAHRNIGDIFDLAVTSSYRRRGVGEKLLSVALGWFKTRGIHRTETRVAATNEVSTAFWRKMGFRQYAAHVFREI